jgi:hypothetical protein
MLLTKTDKSFTINDITEESMFKFIQAFVITVSLFLTACQTVPKDANGKWTTLIQESKSKSLVENGQLENAIAVAKKSLEISEKTLA